MGYALINGRIGTHRDNSVEAFISELEGGARVILRETLVIGSAVFSPYMPYGIAAFPDTISFFVPTDLLFIDAQRLIGRRAVLARPHNANMVRLHIAIPKDLRDYIASAAQAAHMSVSEYVRRVLSGSRTASS